MDINLELTKEQKQSGSDFIAYMATMIDAENASKAEHAKPAQVNLVSQLKSLNAKELEEVRGIVFGEEKVNNEVKPQSNDNSEITDVNVELNESGLSIEK